MSPAVLLLHGLGGDRRQALALLPSDFAAVRIAPDLPGHGDHDLKPDEPLTFAAFATQAADLLTAPSAASGMRGALSRSPSAVSGGPFAVSGGPSAASGGPSAASGGPSAMSGGLAAVSGCPAAAPGDTAATRQEPIQLPVAVVGVSMGAGVALTLAAARPDLVREMVLIRPSWLDQAPPPHLEPFRIIARILAAGGGPDDFRATPVYQQIAAAAPAMAQSLLGQFTRPHAVERARVLDEIPLSRPLPDRADYQALDLPVTIVAAPGDPVHPETLARTMQSWIPGARLLMVPRKMPDPTEHQAAVQRAVAAALRH